MSPISISDVWIILFVFSFSEYPWSSVLNNVSYVTAKLYYGRSLDFDMNIEAASSKGIMQFQSKFRLTHFRSSSLFVVLLLVSINIRSFSVLVRFHIIIIHHLSAICLSFGANSIVLMFFFLLNNNNNNKRIEFEFWKLKIYNRNKMTIMIIKLQSNKQQQYWRTNYKIIFIFNLIFNLRFFSFFFYLFIICVGRLIRESNFQNNKTKQNRILSGRNRYRSPFTS